MLISPDNNHQKSPLDPHGNAAHCWLACRILLHSWPSVLQTYHTHPWVYGTAWQVTSSHQLRLSWVMMGWCHRLQKGAEMCSEQLSFACVVTRLLLICLTFFTPERQFYKASLHHSVYRTTGQSSQENSSEVASFFLVQPICGCLWSMYWSLLTMLHTL